MSGLADDETHGSLTPAAVVTPEAELDRDRVASMADEGGVAAAEVEAELAAPVAPPRRRRRGPGVVGILVIGALAGVALVLALRSPHRPRLDGRSEGGAES